ncbi:hypothetical protein B0H10DRAFT_2089147 [Mycena sp. CBHHK59/15]|nr:hypothetical protein B0H10DRAFT_2089147 [Mycena sp. CBHHK59/15]
MTPPSSPFRLSPSSACSSTLITTPALSKPRRSPAPKGPLQPHITNLPRRRRAPKPIPPPVSEPPAQEPIHLPSPPPLPFPITAGGIPQPRDAFGAPRGPVQPAHANLPRRAKPLTAAQARARKRRERCMQELGRASGVFVALGWGSEDEGTDDDTHDAVVRITPEGNEDEGGDCDGILHVVAPGTRDDGVPCLSPAQLRAACAFLCGRKADAEGRGRVLITASRAHAVDALGLGVGVCCAASAGGDADTHPADAEHVHRLVMRLHDLPADDDGDDGDDGGLKDAWRGLLSRDGMDYVAAALGMRAPTPPPSPSPSPSP